MRLSLGLLALAVAAVVVAEAAATPLMTKADAVALARTINLTASDMPGYSASA